jgi:predicted deacetylase
VADDGKGKRRLLVSIHDVGPAFEREVDGLLDILTRHVSLDRLAMLVVPDHWGEAPLQNAPVFAARLRDWSASGVEMFVHGWFHRDHTTHPNGLARFKAQHMTAGEGEFLGLDTAEAARRMADGRTLIEDVIGRPVAGFIAPAWLYGAGAREALAASGFALAEDHLRIWQPDSGAVLAHGPVVTWASRSRGRILSSLAVAAVARAGLFRFPVLRMAVHPGDLRIPALVRSIDRTLAALVTRRLPICYTDLLTGMPKAQAA